MDFTLYGVYSQQAYSLLKSGCEKFEPRSHFKSRLSLIVWVKAINSWTPQQSDCCAYNIICFCCVPKVSQSPS